MANTFGFMDFLVRFFFALALVLGTYNPSGYSYFHWLTGMLPAVSAEAALAGVAVLIGWAVYVNSTFRSLGGLGVALGLAFFACLVWVLIDIGLLSADSSTTLVYIIEGLIAAILAVGMSWSHLRRRWSGQQDVDEIGDED